jgi:hypothetical protein
MRPNNRSRTGSIGKANEGDDVMTISTTIRPRAPRHHWDWGKTLCASALALLVLLALAACGVSTSSLQAGQIFDKAKGAALKDATFTVTGKVQGNALNTDLNIDVSGKGTVVIRPASAYSLNTTLMLSNAQGKGTATSETISVNDTLYTRAKSDDLPDVAASNGFFAQTPVPSADAALLPQSLDSVQYVGEETVNGQKCWHIRGTRSYDAGGVPVAGGSGSVNQVTLDLWIREGDAFYMRLKMSTPDNKLQIGDKALNGSATVSFTFDFSNWNTGAQVSAPPADQIQPQDTIG